MFELNVLRKTLKNFDTTWCIDVIETSKTEQHTCASQKRMADVVQPATPHIGGMARGI